MKATQALCAVIAAGTLSAGAAAISGCGASATVDPVAQAAQTTQQLPGARVRISEQFSTAALPQAITITGAGFINQRARSGQLDFDLSHIPGVSSLPGDKTVRFLFAYPVLYAHADLLRGHLPGGKSWIRVDLAQAGQAAGINLSQLTSTGASDPSQYLSYLRASGKVTKVGAATVNGASTTHYTAVIDLSRVVGRLPASERAAAQAGVAQLEKLAGTSSLPVSVWVDAHQRIRREQITMHLNLPGGSGALNGLITVDFLSFGPTPAITPPPTSQVYDASALAAAGLKKATGK